MFLPFNRPSNAISKGAYRDFLVFCKKIQGSNNEKKKKNERKVVLNGVVIAFFAYPPFWFTKYP